MALERLLQLEEDRLQPALMIMLTLCDDEIPDDFAADMTIRLVLKLKGWDENTPYEVVNLRACNYKQFLASEAWRQVRELAIDRWGGRCVICNSTDRLEVHHRTYERRGMETPDDVIPLCHGCHGLFHKNGKLAKPGE